MSIRTEPAPRVSVGKLPSAGRIDLAGWAKDHLKKGQRVTDLRAGRGQPNLLEHPAQLARFQVGTFEAGRTRGGVLTAKVYSVPLPGRDDRLKNHVIVDMPFVRSNDTIGHRFYDLGTGPVPKPNV